MMQAEHATGVEHAADGNSELTEALAADEVEPDSTPKNIVIAVVGILLVIAALIPITYAALTIGSVVFASLSSMLNGGAADV